MKRILLFSLGLLLLCFPLIGCDSDEGLASEQIAEIVEKASTGEEPGSCSFDMDLSVTMNVDNDFMPSTMSIKAENVQGSIDIQNQELWIQIPFAMDTGVEEYDEDMTMEIFITNGWGYMNMGDGWTKMEMPQSMWEEMPQSLPVGQLIGLLNLEEISSNGSEFLQDSNGNDVECNVLYIEPDLGQLAEYAFEQFSQSGIGDSELNVLGEVEEILSSFSVDCTFWIAKDSNKVMKARLDLNGSLSSDEIPELGTVGFGNITLDLSAEIVFGDASIPDLPNEALAAEPGYITLPF